MAIDPKLLVLKPVSELETVNNPTTGSLLFYDGGDDLKKTSVSDFYNAMQSAYLGIATTTTTPPATGAFWYRVDTPGTYMGVTVTEADLDGNHVTIEVKDNVAKKVVVALLVQVDQVFNPDSTDSVATKEIAKRYDGLLLMDLKKVGKIDLSTITPDAYLDGGTIKPMPGIGYTDYIKVSPSTLYQAEGPALYGLGGGFYNAKREYITDFLFPDAVNVADIQTLAGVEYLRMNVSTAPNAEYYLRLKANAGKVEIANLITRKLPTTPNESRDIYTFIGAFNFVLEQLFTAKPKARVVMIGHISLAGNTTEGRDGQWYGPLVEAQKRIAEYWGADFLPLYDKLNWVNNPPINTFKTWCPDEIHPYSNPVKVTTPVGDISEGDFIIHNHVKEFLKPIFGENWLNKKVAMYGTSIPAGGKYSELAVMELGGQPFNYSVGGSIIRRGTFTPQVDRLYSFTDPTATINFQTTMLDHIGTMVDPDLYVFDFGINDYNIDQSDF